MKHFKGKLLDLLGFTKWHEATRGDTFVWRRYNLSSGLWEWKEMSPEEHHAAWVWWATK